MGKVSTKENKNMYFLARENLKLSRAAASEILETIPEDRIEKIENERITPHPEDVLAMAKGYKSPELCNYYCSQECPIGKEFVPEIVFKDNVHEILVNMMVSLDAIEQKKSRLMEILADGQIENDEINDFLAIQEKLNQIAMTVDALQLWCDKMVAEGEIKI